MIKIYVRNMLMYFGFLAGMAGIGIAMNGLDVYLNQPYLAVRLVVTTVTALILNYILAKNEYNKRQFNNIISEMIQRAPTISIEELENWN